MLNNLNKVAKDTNIFLKKYLRKQKYSVLLGAMKYGLFPGGKKIRSKILLDRGSLFNVNYKTLIKIGAAVECIHAYSCIHDDLPCMDNDNLRRGKPSTHIKFGESTAVLAGNSLLTMSFEILSDSKLMITDKIKVNLIKKLSECSGHSGIAGGQYLDLNFENKKTNILNIIDMEIKKTGKLFSFCCMVPAIIKNKNVSTIKFFETIGSEIGLLFQIVDDLIDYKGDSATVGKPTKSDEKKGKATLVNLLGYSETLNFAKTLKKKLDQQIKKYGIKANDLLESIEFILTREF